MSRFVDEYINSCVPGYPVVASPRWSTSIVGIDSGSEVANQRWAHPLNAYSLPEAVRDMQIFNSIRDHWLVMRGPAHTWPFRDPYDFASVPQVEPAVVPETSEFDQVLGNANGLQTKFQLVKLYQVGSQQYTRKIHLPIIDTVAVAVDGVLVGESEYSVSRPGGEIEFYVAPESGVVTAGFLFDVEVRFENDDAFDAIVKTYNMGAWADINLLEVRAC